MASNEEDDWETADISLAASKLSLRPTASSFQPRSGPSSAPPPLFNAATADRSGPATTTRPYQPSEASRGGGPQPQTAGQASSSRTPMLLQRSAPNSVPSPASASGLGSGAAGAGKDDDDDWFRGSKPMTNRQIWDSANSRAPVAQVQIISPQPLPQPKVQLLRRPASSSPSNVGNNADSGKGASRKKTLEEREEEYRLARERIFGNSGNDEAGPSTRGAEPVGGSGSGSRSNSGRGSPRESRSTTTSGPSYQPGTSGGSAGPTTWDGLVPTQVRGPSRSSSAGGSGRNSAPGNAINAGVGGPRTIGGGGVVRQPLGPGGGAGFAGAPSSVPDPGYTAVPVGYGAGPVPPPAPGQGYAYGGYAGGLYGAPSGSGGGTGQGGGYGGQPGGHGGYGYGYGYGQR